VTSSFFVAQTVALAAFLVWVCSRVGRGRQAAFAIALWLGGIYALAAVGVLAFGPLPPPMMVAVTVAVFGTAKVAHSRLATAVVERVPLALLVGFQAFRIPVEIFLWLGHRDGFVPVQMKWEGRNFDVVTGVTALLVALAGGRRLTLAWNFLGLALLLNIVVIAILSMPTPLRLFMNEPANRFIATAPYAWLPLFLVQAALLGHLLVFRALRNR
jgi:hypothetical protein